MVWYVIVWNVHNSLLVEIRENHRHKLVIEIMKIIDIFHSINKIEIFQKFENLQNSRFKRFYQKLLTLPMPVRSPDEKRGRTVMTHVIKVLGWPVY